MAVKAKAEITLSRIVDIKSVTRYYLLRSSTASAPSKPTANPPGGNWVKAEPSYTSGSTNTLYFVDLTVMTNDTFSYSEVSKSSSYEAAKAAWNKAQNAQDSIDDLEIGGRNLLIGTGNSVTHTGTGSTNQSTQLYKTSDYYNSISSLAGKQLTLSFEWETTATSGKFIVLTNDTPWSDMSGWIVPSSSNKSGKSIYTFVCGSGFDTGAYTGIELRSDNLTGTVTIKNAMLEFSNKASSWQPAPEDVLSKDEAGSTYTTQLEFSKSSSEIRLDFNKSIASATGDMQSKLDAANDATNQKFGEINKYIRFVDGKIILGETGNQLILTIQNDRVSFQQDGNEVAYFSNNNLYIRRAEVLTTLKVGNYEFTPRNDGGLALRKRGI